MINGESRMRWEYDFHPGARYATEAIDEAGRVYRATYHELGIDPREYAAIETVTLVPALVYYTDSPVQPENGWSGDEHVQRFGGSAIEARVG